METKEKGECFHVHLNLLPLGHIISRKNISFHCYTSDNQLYCCVKASRLAILHDCNTNTKDDMFEHFLQVKSDNIKVTGLRHFSFPPKVELYTVYINQHFT